MPVRLVGFEPREDRPMSHRRAEAIALGTACILAWCGCGFACDSAPNAVCSGVAAWFDRAAASVEAWVDGSLAHVREGVERTHGVFVYTPGVGDALDENWSGLEALGDAKDAIVLVHGLDEPGDVWTDLAPALYDAGHTVVRFDYPNDQAIAKSGAAMFEGVARLRAAGIERIRIVGHSMGGLVSRDMLTAPELYAGEAVVDGHPRVVSLIVVGTPFEGSDFAPLQWIGETRDQIVRCVNRAGCDPRALLGFMYDGRGEASDDLTPGSAYLQSACNRKMSDEIRMTSIIGQALPIDGAMVSDVLGGSWVEWMVGEDTVESAVAFADHAANCVGDGVVSESSACEAQDSGEVIVVRANHRSMLRRTPALEAIAEGLGMAVDAPPSIALILDRVGSDR